MGTAWTFGTASSTRRRLSRAEALLGICLVVSLGIGIAFKPTSDLERGVLPTVLLLVLAGAVLGTTSVRLDAGVLTLGAIPILTAVATMSPAAASLVAVAANGRRTLANRHRYRVPQFAASTAWASAACATRILVERAGAPHVIGASLAISVGVLLNLSVTVLLLSANGDASVGILARKAVSTSILIAYGSFALTAAVCASLLGPSPVPVFQVGCILFLSTFVIRSLDHQQARNRLSHQLADAEERATFGHAMEAVLHRLKNLASVVSANLVEATEAPESSERSISAARKAISEANEVLRQAGVDGRTLFEPHFQPVDLQSLCAELASEVLPLARTRGVKLQLAPGLTTQMVLGDSGLLRDVLTNLLRNAIDHAGHGGHVTIACGARANGWPFAEVIDNGPGVPVTALDTLFVGRASDSTSGAGLGLLASYLIAREHYGKLFYEGGKRRGAVFTLVLPPRADLERRLERLHRRASAGSSER